MKPRLLLVEDDPASRVFMVAAAEMVPADVDSAASVAAAVALATVHDYALWLFDARLPDGSGAELLARLRKQGLSTPALAHTASQDTQEHAALVHAGFLTTLVKPLSAAQLRNAITQYLGNAATTDAKPAPPPGIALGLWDDAAALAAMNGNREHAASLRELFLAELPKQRDDVLAALQRGDHPAAHDLLHRLKASCGFVGAQRLKTAVERLDGSLSDAERVRAFTHAANDTLSSAY